MSYPPPHMEAEPPTVTTSVGALQKRAAAWQAFTRNTWVLSVVLEGFLFPWEDSAPPLTNSPVSFPPPADPARFEILDREVASLVTKQAVSLAPGDSPGFYSRLFTVPKKNGQWRPVLDLSPLNRFIRPIKFKMDTIQEIRWALEEGDWASSVDLSDAYFHVLIHPARRRYLRFVWRDQVYQFQALPFGLSLAPYVFTKVTLEMAAAIRAKGIRLRVYLDDWLNLASSSTLCRDDLQVVLNFAQDLGFTINMQKSDLVSKQEFEYLGVKFNTLSFTCSPSEGRIAALSQTIERFLGAQEVSLRDFLRLLGQMESMSTLLPLARCYKRPLQREVHHRFQDMSNLKAMVNIGPWFRQAVNQWLDPLWLHSAVPIRPRPPQVFLYTDASRAGWGAHCLHGETSGLWPLDLQQNHINWLELMAVWLAMKHFQASLQGRWVTIVSDNSTSLSYISNQGGSHSVTLSLLAEEMLVWAHTRAITLTVEFVPGKLNVIADQLSRKDQILKTEWTIVHRVLERLWQEWGRPHVDLFATQHTARLPVYISPVRDPNAFARNAFALSWHRMSAYAYPPTSLIPRVLAKYKIDLPRLILITPGWPTKAWYPELLRLSHEAPKPLHLQERDLLQPRTGVCHANARTLALTAWLLCGQDCAHKVSNHQ